MPADWVNVNGMVTNLTTALDSKYRYAPCEKVSGKGAADVLKQVDKILQSSHTVLENHKDVLTPEEYDELKKTYRRYHWQMTDESQEFRATSDELIRQSRILSQLYANRDSHEQRARNLLRKVETYQTNVLSASRKATPLELRPFDDELPAQAAATESISTKSSSSRSYTSLFSVFGRSSRATSIDQEDISPKLEPEPADEEDGQEFRVSVTFVPHTSTEPLDHGTEVVGTGSNIYRRVISFEKKGTRLELTDRKLYALNDNERYIAEEKLKNMLSEIGQRLLNELDSESLPVSQITDSPSQSPSPEAMIQKFKTMSMTSKE